MRQYLYFVIIVLFCSCNLARGTTEIFDAASSGDIARVRELIVQTPALVNKEDARQFVGRFTPLHYAAKNGRTDIARLLIKNGANVNAETVTHRTPLHEAAIKGHTDIARLLIERGADVSIQRRPGRTPLHDAAFNGFTDIARLLIEAGAPVDEKNWHGATPLYMAIEGKHVETTQFLMSKGANVNEKNNEGKTPLDLAQRRNFTVILFAHTAHPNNTQGLSNLEYNLQELAQLH